MIEAGLAVRPEERVTPWRYKPLIVEAMRGMVPDQSLTRQTKANGSGDVEPGLRRHRAELLALWEDSRLGALGLVDAAALREACTRPLPPDLQFGVLDQLVACEVWLRSLDRDRAVRSEMTMTLRRGVSTADTDYGTRCWTRTAASTSRSTRAAPWCCGRCWRRHAADAARRSRAVRRRRRRRPGRRGPAGGLHSAGLVAVIAPGRSCAGCAEEDR